LESVASFLNFSAIVFLQMFTSWNRDPLLLAQDLFAFPVSVFPADYFKTIVLVAYSTMLDKNPAMFVIGVISKMHIIHTKSIIHAKSTRSFLCRRKYVSESLI